METMETLEQEDQKNNSSSSSNINSGCQYLLPPTGAATETVCADEETSRSCPQGRWWVHAVVWGTSGVVVTLLSAPQHFMHDWIPCLFVSLWAPISESVWEHSKLVYYPLLLWWLVVLAAAHNPWKIDTGAWMLGCTVSVYVANTTMVALYYLLFCGLCIREHLVWHLLCELVGLYTGVALGHHVYVQRERLPHVGRRSAWLTVLGVTLLLPIVAYALFNYITPRASLFRATPACAAACATRHS